MPGGGEQTIEAAGSRVRAVAALREAVGLSIELVAGAL